MSLLEKIAKTRDELHARLQPYLKPSERQRQLKQEDDLRERRLIQTIGEWRIFLICGWVALIGTGSIPGSVEAKPFFVLFALAVMGFGIYLRYFPRVPPEDAPTQSGGEAASGGGLASPRGKAGVDPSPTESNAAREKRSTET